MKNDLKNKARDLRSNMTIQEQKLWQIIRNRQFGGYRFLRQYVISSYIVDFVCREKKIIIEIDGGHHNEDLELEYDKKRTIFLENKGYKVIRFWNNDIDNNIDGVFQKLKEVFEISG